MDVIHEDGDFECDSGMNAWEASAVVSVQV